MHSGNSSSMGSAKKNSDSEKLARARTRRHSEDESDSENEHDEKDYSDQEDEDDEEEREGAPRFGYDGKYGEGASKYSKSATKFGEGMSSFPQTPQRVDFLHLASPFTPADQHTSMVSVNTCVTRPCVCWQHEYTCVYVNLQHAYSFNHFDGFVLDVFSGNVSECHRLFLCNLKHIIMSFSL
jgi:hypothetical protein